jgi:hypothetical protein
LPAGWYRKAVSGVFDGKYKAVSRNEPDVHGPEGKYLIQWEGNTEKMILL